MWPSTRPRTFTLRKSQMDKHVHTYQLNDEGSYIMEVQTKEGWMCLDAMRCMDSLGRLFNHSSKPNLKPFRALYVRGKWRVGFLANRDIPASEELTWDYTCPPQGQQWLYKCSPTAKSKVCLQPARYCSSTRLEPFSSYYTP